MPSQVCRELLSAGVTALLLEIKPFISFCMKSGAGGRREFLLAHVARIIVLLNLSAINNELVSTTQIQGKVVRSDIFGLKK